jgi:hypothetical protein
MKWILLSLTLFFFVFIYGILFVTGDYDKAMLYVKVSAVGYILTAVVFLFNLIKKLLK